VGSAKRMDTGKIKLSSQEAPARPQQRAQHTALEFKENRQVACFFKVQFVSFASSISTPR